MEEKLMNTSYMILQTRAIAETYGNRYQHEVMQIDTWPSDLLSNDWFASLEFWFSKSFYRGRRDDISDRFRNCAMSVIRNFGKDRLLDASNEELSSLLGDAGVNNHIDRRMVIQSLEFIKKISNYNLAVYSKDWIKAEKTQLIHSELQSIFGIGPKLASFYLRDLCFIYKLSPKNQEQLVCLFPVDTWVKKVSVKLGIPGCTKGSNVEDIVEPVVQFCMNNKISPLLFNAGAWLIGAMSFDMLFELL
jgi:endonuclease III